MPLQDQELKFIKRIYIPAQGADPSPPLGTVLGNLGVNTNTFCTNFNSFTKKLPSYFSLAVTIFIYDNRTTSFVVGLPSIGYILNLLKFEKTIKINVAGRMQEKVSVCVSLYSLLQLAKFKFPLMSLEQSLPIVLGSVNSMKLTIVD